MFILKPPKNYHGKRLRGWYRRVLWSLTSKYTAIPSRWEERPIVKVQEDKLPVVMNALYKTSVF